MKTAILIFVLSASFLITAAAQNGAGKFGFEANQFIVESGFGSGTELQVYYLDHAGKRLSLGLYYDSKLNKLGGISVSAVKLLANQKKSGYKVVEPYLFYNLIYHKTTIAEPVQSENFYVAVGTYKSMEHHIGAGLRLNIVKNFYLKGEMGYGLYLGSIMKPSKPDALLNESYGTHGTGALIKIGVGTLF
jgi:hypothetical protein